MPNMSVSTCSLISPTQGCTICMLPLSQAAWARFSEGEPHAALCMLQPSLLTVYHVNGELQQVPVPAGISSMHALPEGLLLSVSPSFCRQHHGRNLRAETVTSSENVPVLLASRKRAH